MPSHALLEQIVAKFAARTNLERGDVDALLSIPFSIVHFARAKFVVREGDRPNRCHLVLEGFTYRQKTTRYGTRQIVGIDVAGDFACLSLLFLPRSDHDIVTLTDVQLAEFDLSILQQLALTRPAIGRAMWMEALVAASIVREWTLNVGRRNARARLSHLICELALRLGADQTAGVQTRYDLPMTQEELGDTVGLTSIHVNRNLKSLEADGLIKRSKRHITIADFASLARVGDFDGSYLFLGEAARGGPDTTH